MRSAEGPAPPGHEWVEQLFRAHYEELCAFVHSFLFSDDAAEDLVQDLFVSIWRNPARWTDAGDALRPLLFVAARNRALDALRHRRVRERHVQRTAAEGEVWMAPPADDELAHKEIQQEIAAAIATLPDRAREIFLLSRNEGLTYREIAERLEISVKTVENQMGRSLKKLRVHLDSYLSLLIATMLG